MAGEAQCAVLAGWDVNGIQLTNGVGVVTNTYPYTFLATTQHVEIVSATLELGAGVNPSTSPNQYGFKISEVDQTNSLAGAIERNHYIEFSLTVASGSALNLQQITMNGESTATGCSNVVLMSSMDGFVAGQEIASAFPANKTGGFDTDSSGFGASIDLSAARYQNVTDTVTFRLYGWNSKSGSGVTRIYDDDSGDDLVVSGEVVSLPPQAENPVLNLSLSNGMAQIAVSFTEASAVSYELQQCTQLVPNDWKSVSAPFATNTVWSVEATNSTGFFRAVPVSP